MMSNGFQLLNRFFFFLFLLTGLGAQAITLSNSGEEIEFNYETSFRSLTRAESVSKSESADLAANHAAHLFGLFQSSDGAVPYGYYQELVEGFAGLKTPTLSNIKSYQVDGDPYIWVSYKAQGTMIVLNKVLAAWLDGKRSGQVVLPLLVDLPAIYSDDGTEYKNKKWVKCTDNYYKDPSDFSYFYNPYRCKELGQEPIANNVTFKIAKINPAGSESKFSVPLEKFHAANGNGKLTAFYFVNGYYEVPDTGSSIEKIKRDEGYKTFAANAKLLVKKFGFTEMGSKAELEKELGDSFDKIDLMAPVTMENPGQRRFFRTFVKIQGNEILVARAALFDTSNEAKSDSPDSFPSFWKEAWQNGDFVYFGGHSGDGQSLDLKNMLDTLERKDIESIRTKSGKTQVVLIDACSSYDHYQDVYVKKKNKELYLITFGLVSLFHQAATTVETMLDLFATPHSSDPTWGESLATLEHNQLVAHVNYFYEAKDRAKTLADFQKEKAYPSYLINVRVPE